MDFLPPYVGLEVGMWDVLVTFLVALFFATVLVGGPYREWRKRNPYRQPPWLALTIIWALLFFGIWLAGLIAVFNHH